MIFKPTIDIGKYTDETGEFTPEGSRQMLADTAEEYRIFNSHRAEDEVDHDRICDQVNSCLKSGTHESYDRIESIVNTDRFRKLTGLFFELKAFTSSAAIYRTESEAGMSGVIYDAADSIEDYISIRQVTLYLFRRIQFGCPSQDYEILFDELLDSGASFFYIIRMLQELDVGDKAYVGSVLADLYADYGRQAEGAMIRSYVDKTYGSTECSCYKCSGKNDSDTDGNRLQLSRTYDQSEEEINPVNSDTGYAQCNLTFVTCVNDERMYEEALYYINRLFIPPECSVDSIAIREAPGMAAGYNAAMNATDADIIVYLHQDVCIINPFFIYELISIFGSDPHIGMIGMIGSPKLPPDAVMWHGRRVGNLYSEASEELAYDMPTPGSRSDLHYVEAVDGFLIATNRRIPWREDICDGWDFYDISQSREYINKRYKIVVPDQISPWTIHDDGIMNLYNYDRYRTLYMNETMRNEDEHIPHIPTMIMIVEGGEEDAACSTVKSIRTVEDTVDSVIVLVNNGGSPDLGDLISQYDNLVYIDMEGSFKYGFVLNQVIDALQICTDVMLIHPGFMPVSPFAGVMEEELYRSDKIAAVGPVGNTLIGGFQELSNLTDYETAVSAYESNTYTRKNGRVISLEPGAVLFKQDVLKIIGAFDEEMVMERSVIDDYCLRINKAGLECVYTSDAMFWSSEDVSRKTVEPCESRMESKWGMHYFGTRPSWNLPEMICHDKYDEFNVLEIGCDCGATLLEISNRYPNAEIHGTEINPAAAEIAGCVADVSVGNIEDEDLAYPDGFFDYILFGDVLEHLHNPLETVKYCHRLLKDGGHIIASIPNVMHISVMEGLLNGDFHYEETGLLDKTHIHLFTAKEIVKMFNQGGFSVEDMRSVIFKLSEGSRGLIDKLMEISTSDVERVMYETFQYVILARKNL